MRLVQFDNVDLLFPGRVLFKGVTWSIFRGDRVGLIGPNGAGKTTVLKLLNQDEEPTSGTIHRTRDLTIGYLPQHGILHKGKTLFQEAWNGLPDLPHIELEIKDLRDRIENSPEDGDLIEMLGVLEHRWQDLEGYHAEAKVARVLSGLGFKQSDFERKTEEFSGGWQMRIALAKLLLFDPDLLMMDEPTNHLDLPALIWLEEFMSKFDGALLLVSHDRYFLDRVITKTAELELASLTLYPGNYSQYLAMREARREQAEGSAERIAEERKRIEAFVEKFRYKASKARQVQSRVKMLEKMEDVEIKRTSKKVRFHFPSAPPSGRITLELSGLGRSYGELDVFRNVDLVLARGEKVALVGANGAGKSTMCRLITGNDTPTTGKVALGHNVQVDYFAQEADFHLRPGATVLSEMEAEAKSATPETLRSLLGAFLFTGDDVFKPVSVLSGGEKARLALAKMLLHPSNFLILDEPTNHLDMNSQEVLLHALNAYDGTLFVVSHDRYFLDRLVNRVLELEGGRLRDWPGNLSEFLERKSQNTLSTGEVADNSRIPVSEKPLSAPKSKEQRRAEAEVRNKFSRQLKDARELTVSLQETIDRNEKRKRELESKLADVTTYQDADKSKKFMQEYDKVRQELAAAYDAWTVAAAELESLERQKEDEVRAGTDRT